MAYDTGNTRVKKEYYNIFFSLKNMSAASLATAFSTFKVAMRKLDAFLVETRGAGATVNVTNSTGTLVLLVDNTTTTVTKGTITDGKTRVIANLKPNGVAATVLGTSIAKGECVLLDGNTAVGTVFPFFPLGACLAEPSFANEKGDEISINSGDKLTISTNTTISFVQPSACSELRSELVNFPNVGVLFVSKTVGNCFYLNNLVPFGSVKITGNALNQTEYSITKEMGLTYETMIEG